MRGEIAGIVAGIASWTAAVALGQAPRIDSISPSQGPIAGGTVVTVRGSSLAGAAVKVDRSTVTPQSHTNTQIELRMPRHDNGYVLIQAGSASAEYLYVAPRLEDLPPGFITTVAGVGRYVRVEVPATEAMIDPTDVTVAANGDIYYMEVAHSLLFRIDSDGILHHVAGTLSPFDPELVGDGGAAVDAFFGFSRSVAVDAAGNAYITDSRARIRKIEAATGIVSTVAGTGEMGYSGDGGPAAQAQIGEPTHIACAPDGTLYFVDALPVGGGTPRNLRVRRVSPTGIITTVAGNGSIGDDGDGGPAVLATLNIGLDDAGDIAIDGAQNVFILEYDGQRIRRVDGQSGVITTFASLAFPPGDPRTSALMPAAIAIDGSGNVYAATSWNFFKFDPAGRLLDKWGGTVGFSEDGTPAREMKIGALWGMAVAPNGDLIFSVGSARRIRKVDAATQTLKTVAGIAPNAISIPGDARGAVLASPHGDLAFLPSGDLLYSDVTERRIYRIDVRSGTITPFAGTGTTDYGAYLETPALQASVDAPGICANSQGVVYMADLQTIRSIDPQGIVHRIAGLTAVETNNDYCGFSGDGGPAAEARLCQPNDVVLDRRGNLYIADTNNNRVRRVDTQTGIITTVAGGGTTNGLEGYGRGSFCGDGGPAVAACFNTPVAVAVQDDGTMYIADFYNGVKVRKVDSAGIVSTLPWPGAINLVVGPGQSIFGYSFSSIYRADHDETRDVLAGPIGFAGDGGPVSQALMAAGSGGLARGLAIDAEGNLFFQDGGNFRIRAIRFGGVLAPPDATVQAIAIGSTIRATVFDNRGRTAPGVRVDFSTPSSGASCMLSSPFAITDRNGLASVTCTSNCVPGTYSVTATPLTAPSTASVSLTNPTGPCRRRAVHH
jgi:streptogramin lyase